MKFRNNVKFNTIAAYALIVIAFGLIYALVIFNLGAVFGFLTWLLGKLKTVLYAAFFAFLGISPMRFFDRILTKHLFRTKRRQPLVRVLSVILTILLFVIILLVFILAIVPSLQSGFQELQQSLNPAIEETGKWIEQNLKQSALLLPIYTELTDYLSAEILGTSGDGLFSVIAGYLGNIANEASAMFLGLVLGMYCLLFRRKISSISAKIVTSLLPNRFNTFAFKGLKRTYFYFMEYLSIRVISAIYLALLSYLICWVFGIPYRSLVAIVVFVFNLVPRFGGALITAILPLFLLILNRRYALPLFLILLVLHVLHNFMVEPFFLRKRLRPNIGMTIALTLIFSALFGFVGFVFAVPMYATIHAVIQNMQTKRLLVRSLPVSNSYYLTLDLLTENEELEDDGSGDDEEAGDVLASAADGIAREEPGSNHVVAISDTAPACGGDASESDT